MNLSTTFLAAALVIGVGTISFAMHKTHKTGRAAAKAVETAKSTYETNYARLMSEALKNAPAIARDAGQSAAKRLEALSTLERGNPAVFKAQQFALLRPELEASAAKAKADESKALALAKAEEEARLAPSVARHACKARIIATLHDPDSAEFGKYWDWPTTISAKDQSYASVQATFRAKNGFGALRIHTAHCMVRKEGEYTRTIVLS